MNKAEIKQILEQKLESMESAKYGCATNKDYRTGKINGMIEAFRIVGYISKDEAFELIDELL